MLDRTKDLMAHLLGDSGKGGATPGVARTAGSSQPVIGDARQTPEFAKIHPHYEEWTKAQLYSEAQKLEIHGRSSMDKQELIEAIRGQK